MKQVTGGRQESRRGERGRECRRPRGRSCMRARQSYASLPSPLYADPHIIIFFIFMSLKTAKQTNCKRKMRAIALPGGSAGPAASEAS